jgi:uncharacterized protein YidB (DUF937 family)
MGNPLLGQILTSALTRGANARGGALGGLGGGLGGAALGGLLAGMVGRGERRPGSNRGMLLALMLPLAMQWVQRNGGIGNVLGKLRQQGMGRQADSWVSTGDNHPVSPDDVQRLVGDDEIAAMAARLGVPREQVSQAFAEILPELTDKLTPQGTLPPNADQALEGGHSELEKALHELHEDAQHLP